MKKQYESIIQKYIPTDLQDYIINDLIDKDCLHRMENSFSQGVLKDYLYTLEWRRYVARSKY